MREHGEGPKTEVSAQPAAAVLGGSAGTQHFDSVEAATRGAAA